MENLLTYKSLDPDELYYKFPEGSITFFYVPNTDNLYVSPYPTNHQDMLVDDDDLFDDVYGDLDWSSKERKDWASRGKALSLTNTLLGRISAVGENFIISFWKNPPKKHFQGFLVKLFQKFPSLTKKKDSIVVVAPQVNPVYLSGKSADDTVSMADTVPAEKKFFINGDAYSLHDLQNLRASVHSKNFSHGNPFAVLCHPDMDKYPELIGYKPSNCDGETGELRQTHPERWREKGRATGEPYVYKYGENFKDFIRNNE